jgi:hypothetical protein
MLSSINFLQTVAQLVFGARPLLSYFMFVIVFRRGFTFRLLVNVVKDPTATCCQDMGLKTANLVRSYRAHREVVLTLNSCAEMPRRS